MSGCPLLETKWPEAAPADGEEFVLSISCGNTHLHWATHYGVQQDFSPKIFWRTPHLQEDDLSSDELSSGLLTALSRNLPDEPHASIFGEAEASLEAAHNQAALRAVSLISVYIVSTNRTQANYIAQVWKDVPSRVYLLNGEDFFREDQGRYDTMGTDRLATLLGAAHLHGHPALVFDGGTATTYSATDSTGQILGGGIGPGLFSKLSAMSTDTDALPHITTTELQTRVQDALTNKQPLPTFATNTKDAMMADVLQDIALKGRNVIDQWLRKAYPAEPPKLHGGKYNTEKHVFCTGGDCDILQLLLQPTTSMELFEWTNHNPEPSDYKVEVVKHLIHYGVAAVLLNHVKRRHSNTVAKKSLPESYIGRRVAKTFDIEADDGDNIYRGRVAKIIDLEEHTKEYRINYDDGDCEDVSHSTLMEMFDLYKKHGEKKSLENSLGKRKGSHQKVSSQVSNNSSKEEKALKLSSTIDTTKGPASKQRRLSEPIPKTAKGKKSGKVASSNGGNQRHSDSKKKTTINKMDGDTMTTLGKNLDGQNPLSFIHQRVAKDFNQETYYGTVMGYDDSETPVFWHVKYDDGDEEDFTKKELAQALKHYDKHRANDTVKSDK